MIPALVKIGGPLCVLPPGVHDAILGEIKTRFATTEHRRSLFEGFKAGVDILQQAGCQTIFLDGSFISEKLKPNDFDACWDPTGVDPEKLDPILLDFSDMRLKQKIRFGGEFFPSTCLADTQNYFLDFFQIDKYTGKAKGIIRLSFPQNQRERERK